jgi:tetratricopeptide (TPR) repeat protein
MVSLYDPESVTDLIAREACKMSPEMCADHYLAYQETLETVDSPERLKTIISATPQQFRDLPFMKEALTTIMNVGVGSAIRVPASAEYSKASTSTETLIRKGIRMLKSGEIKQGLEKIGEGIRHLTPSHLDHDPDIYIEVLSVLDGLLERDANEEGMEFQENVGKAMLIKGNMLGHLDRPEEAIAVYDEVLARFGEARETVPRKLVAIALTKKGILLCKANEFEAAETAYHQAIEIFPDLSAPAIRLIELFLKTPEKIESALALAGDMIDRKPADSALRNGVAWVLYEHGDRSLLSKAKDWSQQAVSFSPDPAYHHTLACILSALGKGEDALKSAKHYMQDTGFVRKSIEDAIELFVALSASGKGKEALDILVNSSVAKHLEPLIIGIKLYIGEEVKTAVEIREVAKDVAIRIEEQVKRWGHHNPVAG